MKTAWMIRSGGRGAQLELFESGIVAIGYDVPTDLSGTKTLADIKKAYFDIYPEDSSSDAGGPCGSLHKFVHLMADGDTVMTYDPHQRVYWIGKLAGGYFFEPTPDTPLPHRRKVLWGETHYEAERSNVPLKLLDLDALAQLIETHYESFDTEGRALLLLTRIYWPAD